MSNIENQPEVPSSTSTSFKTPRRRVISSIGTRSHEDSSLVTPVENPEELMYHRTRPRTEKTPTEEGPSDVRNTFLGELPSSSHLDPVQQNSGSTLESNVTERSGHVIDTTPTSTETLSTGSVALHGSRAAEEGRTYHSRAHLCADHRHL